MRVLALLAVALASSAVAQTSTNPDTGKKMGDVAGGPAEDINVKRKAIPPVLQAASADPYAPAGACAALARQVAALNAVLGPDFDSHAEVTRRISGTRVAKGVVQGFIPFRGVIREVTGAASSERRYNAAVDAGIARRGYLRGIASARGCR